MIASNRHSTWIEIDLAAISDNIKRIAEITRSTLMVVVKADGYGHGATQVTRAALGAGAIWCAVARIEEALELRQNGITAPILIMGLTPTGFLTDALREGISLTVWSRDQLSPIAVAAESTGKTAALHLKVNTGMNRLGSQPDQVLELAQDIVARDSLALEGVFTHFACADQPDAQANQEQLSQFLQTLAALEGQDLRPEIVHAANSAAALTNPEARFDCVRIGISMYGLEPFATPSLPEGIHPALAWKTQISQIRIVPAGAGVSYGHEYVASSEERIGTLPVGYGDGFRLQGGNQVLVQGKVAPIVGRVCMDQCLVQLDGVPQAQEGDEVVIIGKQGGSEIAAEDVAERWGTINYEVTCGINSRVLRLYSGP
jgi:alanine racemase